MATASRSAAWNARRVTRSDRKAPGKNGENGPLQEIILFITNQTLAGRSASRRMYQGNQELP